MTPDTTPAAPTPEGLHAALALIDGYVPATPVMAAVYEVAAAQLAVEYVEALWDGKAPPKNAAMAHLKALGQRNAAVAALVALAAVTP